ncbi:MAG TPA: hypothetical protein VIL49_02165 [Capillimicrobium sp.]|jgi:hypothetical protein
MRRPLLALAASLAAVALAAPAAAHAEQSAALDVSAELLEQPAGGPWSINLGVGVNVTTPDGGPPSPLQSIDLRFPEATINDRGWPTCSVEKLENEGRDACPRGSVIGRGRASADARPLLENAVPANLVAYVGPRTPKGRILLFSAVTTQVVNLHLVMPGLLEKTKGRYGYRLTLEIPEIKTIPGSAPAAVTFFDVKIDGHRDGRSFLSAPRRCPRGGLPFAGTFGYADGSRSTAQAAISCTLRATSDG